jgi:hypothetical protein
MFEWLKKPYPNLYESLKVRIKVALFIAVFVFLFLVVFKPFDIDRLIKVDLYLGALFYGLLSGAVTFLSSGLLIRLFPDYFADSGWTIGKEILMMTVLLLLVSIGNGILGYYIELCPPGQEKSIWVSIYSDIIRTYSVGIFPVSILTAISYSVFLKRNLANAIANNKQFEARIENETPAEPEPDPIITIISQANNNDFSFRLNDLLFVMADGNYVEFHLESEDTVKREIRRNTLSHIESQLSEYQFLFRSHRAYLVNLKKVVHSSGNAQGYALKLVKTDHAVPVSRRNLTRFDELIQS